MTIVDEGYVKAGDLSSGWLDAVKCLLDVPNKKSVHLIVRILDPTETIEAVAMEAQRLIDHLNASGMGSERPDVLTTRNTIFPAAWARRHPHPEDLSEYYLERYKKDGLLAFPRNSRGTYFGRIVAYPRGEAPPGNQLLETIRKLREELKGKRPKSSRYEINIYCEAKDRNPMSFPCLAHLSVHFHQGHLHMQAVYRNEFLVERGYGNFSGLAELQAYIAQSVGVPVGELLITMGHVELDAPKGLIKEMLARLDSPLPV